MTASLIHTTDELGNLCRRINNAPWIALDTEFVRERTYYAKLCLIQIATPDVIACVDPLVLDDIKPLLDVIYNPGTLKVLHSARQDLEVFFDLRRDVPGPIFDTQIAAAFLGFDDQIGYAPLVEAVTGVKLDKAHTRANWAARPLLPEYLQYAEDDVRYLRDVYLHLEQRLKAAGRVSWLADEFARLSDSRLYRNEPAQAWQRVKHGHRLPANSQNILQALCAWRERTAQSHNLPRSWVLRDTVMFDIARRAPQTGAQLATIKDMEEKTVRKWSADIVDIVLQHNVRPDRPIWSSPTPLTPQQTQLCRQMAGLLDETARAHQLSSAALGTRRDIQKLVQGDRGVPLLQGWRHDMIGQQLLALIDTGMAATADR